jgi:hypothetical protein
MTILTNQNNTLTTVSEQPAKGEWISVDIAEDFDYNRTITVVDGSTGVLKVHKKGSVVDSLLDLRDALGVQIEGPKPV